MDMQLVNQNVKLRPIVSTDASVLMELNNNELIKKFVVGHPQIVNMEEQLKWMEKISYEHDKKRFAIDYKGKPVGTVIISNIDEINRTATMNIKILPNSHGKGIGTKALELGCKYAFQYLQMYCLVAHILNYNLASQKIFRKIGFQKDGVFRSRIIKNGERCDLVVYSLLKSEFESK